MQVTTVRNKPKSFAWSYSKLKNFETCPKRHWHLDIQRDIKEPEGEALLWGNAVHKALAERVEKNTPLPKTMAEYEKWAERITAGSNSTILVEQKLDIAMKISERVYVMGRGTIVFEGTPAKLRENAIVRKEWLEV
jgi:hypothetical protein